MFRIVREGEGPVVTDLKCARLEQTLKGLCDASGRPPGEHCNVTGRQPSAIWAPKFSPAALAPRRSAVGQDEQKRAEVEGVTAQSGVIGVGVPPDPDPYPIAPCHEF